MTTLIIGSSGFVGRYFIELDRKNSKGKYLTPTHQELDITVKSQVDKFFAANEIEVVINFAGYTNMDESEKERGKKNKRTWITNYMGVKILAQQCKAAGIFLIQISTDAVFPGTDRYPGPYKETDMPPTNGVCLNWYGFTKLKAEEEIKKLKKNFAIIRISHPFGNLTSQRDLISKTIIDIKRGHPLFTDQLFTPTYLEDLSKAILKIGQKKASGIFHIGCDGLVARIEFDRYLAGKLKLKEVLRIGSLQEFMSAPNRAPRTRLGGFITTETQKKLGIKFHHWQEALDKTLLAM